MLTRKLVPGIVEGGTGRENEMEGKVEERSRGFCRELTGVRSECGDSLAGNSEKHSINCRVAVHISNLQMVLVMMLPGA